MSSSDLMQKYSGSNLSSDAARVEEARIKAAYAKRRDDNIRYSCFNRGELFMMHGRERELLTFLQRYGFESLAGKKILEIGCGTGHWLREFVKWGARPGDVTGVDLLFDRVVEARQLCPSSANVQCGSAAELAFRPATFDLVFQLTVFTSVLNPGMKREIAAEMLRVLKPHGLIIWYDYHVNNPWNSDVRGVTKKEIRKLFPGCSIDLKRITLAPPVARWIAPRSWLLASILETIPFLCTHYLGVIQKARQNARLQTSYFR
jgi:SAM-dependent methyltransferase